MKSLRAIVDRIEDEMAVLLVGNEELRVVMPIGLLPEDTVEGSVLNISIDTDPAATEEARNRVQCLINKLSGGDS
jgi:hypothetical protein